MSSSIIGTPSRYDESIYSFSSKVFSQQLRSEKTTAFWKATKHYMSLKTAGVLSSINGGPEIFGMLSKETLNNNSVIQIPVS